MMAVAMLLLVLFTRYASAAAERMRRGNLRTRWHATICHAQEHARLRSRLWHGIGIACAAPDAKAGRMARQRDSVS